MTGIEKVAFVTGSSRGIGKAIVLALARLGCSVVIHYNSRKEEASQVKRQVDEIIKSAGRWEIQKSIIVQANVANSKQVSQCLMETRIAFPNGIDYLICSAGVILYKPTLNISESELNYILDTNVKGTILFNQGVFSISSIFESGKALEHEKPLIKPGGVILNISSSATALNPIPHNYALYVASKGAVEQFSKAFAQEIGRSPYRVRLNVISPGPTDTELFREGKSPEQIEKLAKLSVFDRIGTVEEVANGIVAFLKDDTAWIVGQNIRINGGTAS